MSEINGVPSLKNMMMTSMDSIRLRHHYCQISAASACKVGNLRGHRIEKDNIHECLDTI